MLRLMSQARTLWSTAATPRGDEGIEKAKGRGRKMSAKTDRTKRNTLKVLLSLGAALALPFGMAVPAGAEDLSGTLSFMVAEYSAKTAPFWQEQVKAFEAAHPGVKVSLEVVGWQQMHDTTAQRIAAGSLPGLVKTAATWLPERVEAGAGQGSGRRSVLGAVRDALLR